MAYSPSEMPGMKAGQAYGQKPQFQQYQAPNNQQTEQLAQGQVNGLLQSGGSLPPDVVAKLKARSKQQALGMADQQKAQAQQFLAQRGFQQDGGTAAGANAQIDSNLISSILGMNRDTDIQAATTNHADKQNAVNLANSFLSGQQGRSSDQFRNVLAGQGAQADSDFRIAGFGEDQRRYDSDYGLKAWVAQEQAKQAADDARMREVGMRHGMGMDLANFGENQRQYDNTLGFQYGQANQAQNNTLMDYLMRAFG
jgi:hypothetical protein